VRLPRPNLWQLHSLLLTPRCKTCILLPKPNRATKLDVISL
jgi:hypothetical protein